MTESTINQSRPSVKEKYFIHEPKQRVIQYQIRTLQYLQHHITKFVLSQNSALHLGVLNQIFHIIHTLPNNLQAQLAPSIQQSYPIHLMPSRATRINSKLSEYESIVHEENELLDKLRTCQSIIEAILYAFAEERDSIHLLTVEDVLMEIHSLELELRTELLHLRLDKVIHQWRNLQYDS
ncbi:hypothetical protein HQN90_11005 [Paenibacillus alba]|nr:hypothetical protein [Paenibacillus alba]